MSLPPKIKIWIAVMLATGLFFEPLPVFARTVKRPVLSARAAVVIDAANGGILFGKNPYLKLPPASTTKVLTALLVLENMPLSTRAVVSQKAVDAAPSKAGLTLGAEYSVKDLLIATLVSSSNDAAVTLAEAVAGDEENFVKLMNAKAASLGMKDTKFVNATGLTDRHRKQYTTAYDLAILMRAASKDPMIDGIMGITTTTITGTDGHPIPLKSHNKMLWKEPGTIKGKTGWTHASRHTFVGTDYAMPKTIMFAILSSQKPWADIKRLVTFGLLLSRQN